MRGVSKDALCNSPNIFLYLIDDIDELQTDMALVNEFTKAAADQLAVKIDQNVLATYAAGADADNKGANCGAISHQIQMGTNVSAATSVQITGGESGNALNFILDAGQVLDEE